MGQVFAGRFALARWFLALALFSGTGPAFADDYADGMAFFRSGQYTQAFDAYLRAARAGQVAAQHNVGNMYAEGLGVAKSDKDAFVWFRKAADKGFVLSERSLARMYLEGRGVRRDDAKALGWFKKAGEQGDARSQYMVGILYARGDANVRRNYPEARVWLKRAAEQGEVDAMYSLGMLNEAGLGGAQDIDEALRWYAKAASRGHLQSTARVDALKAGGSKVAIRQLKEI